LSVHYRGEGVELHHGDCHLPLIVARLSKPMEIGFDFEESA
jgi:hypothetical protein